MRKALQQARAKKGLTQAEVAALVGIRRASYTHIERGSRNPSIQVARRIAQVLECSLDELFSEESGAPKTGEERK
ncbi:MAG: helix-turn-helix transcriptional regulator [Firmicutes bacterium]|nr:helix-turn-helix transcriptional regulator [Bacillota bacterium]